MVTSCYTVCSIRALNLIRLPNGDSRGPYALERRSDYALVDDRLTIEEAGDWLRLAVGYDEPTRATWLRRAEAWAAQSYPSSCS